MLLVIKIGYIISYYFTFNILTKYYYLIKLNIIIIIYLTIYIYTYTYTAIIYYMCTLFLIYYIQETEL